jgi:hypothetical protein
MLKLHDATIPMDEPPEITEHLDASGTRNVVTIAFREAADIEAATPIKLVGLEWDGSLKPIEELSDIGDDGKPHATERLSADEAASLASSFKPEAALDEWPVAHGQTAPPTLSEVEAAALANVNDLAERAHKLAAEVERLNGEIARRNEVQAEKAEVEDTERLDDMGRIEAKGYDAGWNAACRMGSQSTSLAAIASFLLGVLVGVLLML